MVIRKNIRQLNITFREKLREFEKKSLIVLY